MKKKKELQRKMLRKKVVIFFLLFFLCLSFAAATGTTATDDDFGLNSKVNLLLSFVSSPWVKGVACLALIAECIGLITAGRQEPGMFKKFIPWIAGTLLFMAAGTITSKFVTINSSTFTDVLKTTQ